MKYYYDFDNISNTLFRFFTKMNPIFTVFLCLQWLLSGVDVSGIRRIIMS